MRPCVAFPLFVYILRGLGKQDSPVLTTVVHSIRACPSPKAFSPRFRVQSRGFLKHMVRRIVGLLVQAAVGGALGFGGFGSRAFRVYDTPGTQVLKL